MQISINLKIFLFAILFYITKQIEIYSLLMIFAIIHELGHLIAGIIMGFKPKELKIRPLGLSVEFIMPIEEYNKKIMKSNLLNIKKIIIYIAGPLVNLVIAIIYSLCDLKIFDFRQEYIVYSNLIILFFNLLPIYPLDRK